MYRAGVNVTVSETDGAAGQKAQKTAPEASAQTAKAQETASASVQTAAAGTQSIMDAQDTGTHATRFLFTTKTCPNCKIAKEMLKDEPYEVVDAEENLDLVSQYGIMQAPTLIVLHDGVVDKYVNASNIKRYVDQLVSNA